MSTVLWGSLSAWWPEALLSIGGLKIVLIGVWCKRPHSALTAAWAFLLAAAAALWLSPVPPATDVFFGLIVCDSFSLVFRWLSLGVVALTLLLIGAGGRSPPMCAPKGSACCSSLASASC